MNTKNLEYFIKVVEANSFTKAAEESFISQSAISQQIKALEDDLGFQLRIYYIILFSLASGILVDKFIS